MKAEKLVIPKIMMGDKEVCGGLDAEYVRLYIQLFNVLSHLKPGVPHTYRGQRL